MGIRHLFFDLDNTILDFTHASHQAFRDLLDHFGHNNYESYSDYNVGNRSVWKAFEKGQISAKKLRAERFELYHKKMGWQGDGLEWNSVYMQYVIRHNKFVEGALALLEDLSQNFDLHIVTNGLREAQRPRITTAGLDPYFKSITVSDEIGSAKPQASFFETAMKNANIKNKEEVLMIGDGYRSDIVGGHNFGLKTCWFNFEKKEVVDKIHDFEIYKISELREVL